MQITQCSKKCHTRLMRSAIIKTASQNEQQNQTTVTSKNNYIQNFVSKKLNSKVKIVSDKPETKQNKL